MSIDDIMDIDYSCSIIKDVPSKWIKKIKAIFPIIPKVVIHKRKEYGK